MQSTDSECFFVVCRIICYMRKTILCFFLLVLVTLAEAQGGRSFQLYSAEGGSFTRQSYDSNIIKIVYTPSAQVHEPNLSDAVY